ncbi:MAG: hypothetical protein GF403_05205 [Candidatus Coatesbacteria bacterium]|nr:hypothetical protein [Candidatus Coatesbacteria bacterium]
MPYDIAAQLTVAYFEKHTSAGDTPDDYLEVYRKFLTEISAMLEEFGYLD